MNRTIGSEDPFAGVRWSTLDLEDFVDLYRGPVSSRLETQGKDPETHRPTHQWFRENDLRPFLTALRRHHDLSFGAFWTDVLGHDADDGYDWGTDDEETTEALESFLERRRTRHDLGEASIEAKRRRLNVYVRAYVAANGADDLLSPVARDNDSPAYEAVDACYAAFDHINRQEYSAATKQRVRGVVDDWYQHLVGRRIARVNPATGLYDEFRWETTASDPASLDSAHVRRLMTAAVDSRERLLVVALAAWGLRANEVARLHADQVVRDSAPPYLAFDERKNGPGEVSVFYGLESFDERVDELASDPDWQGYLFPSAQGSDPHVTRERIWAWFRDLADRADLPASIDGERPSPQLCRRFWYETYSAALDGVLEGMEEIAAEQGSQDPRVVMENYLSDARSRELRRQFMRDRLAEAFE